MNRLSHKRKLRRLKERYTCIQTIGEKFSTIRNARDKLHHSLTEPHRAWCTELEAQTSERCFDLGGEGDCSLWMKERQSAHALQASDNDRLRTAQNGSGGGCVERPLSWSPPAGCFFQRHAILTLFHFRCIWLIHCYTLHCVAVLFV